jgi:hypothetical protein
MLSSLLLREDKLISKPSDNFVQTPLTNVGRNFALRVYFGIKYGSYNVFFIHSFFFFPFGVLQLMLPEAPLTYGLLYYPRIGLSNLLHQFRAAPPPKQRKLEL